MREIWMMQPRFEKRTGNTPFSLVEQPRFRAGFDFMRLRADIGEVDVLLADWWQEFSLASDAMREDLVAQLREEQHKGQRRVRAPRPADRVPGNVAVAAATAGPAPVPVGATGEAIEARDTGEAGASDAPRKRRRRRRKPSGEGGARPQAEPAGPHE
jgi:poly(A) polymerase